MRAHANVVPLAARAACPPCAAAGAACSVDFVESAHVPTCPMRRASDSSASEARRLRRRLPWRARTPTERRMSPPGRSSRRTVIAANPVGGAARRRRAGRVRIVRRRRSACAAPATRTRCSRASHRWHARRPAHHERRRRDGGGAGVRRSGTPRARRSSWRRRLAGRPPSVEQPARPVRASRCRRRRGASSELHQCPSARRGGHAASIASGRGYRARRRRRCGGGRVDRLAIRRRRRRCTAASRSPACAGADRRDGGRAEGAPVQRADQALCPRSRPRSPVAGASRAVAPWKSKLA